MTALAIAPDALAEALAQPFRPLARGAKLRVYASADGRMVLKLPVSPEDLAEWFRDDGRPLLSTGWVPGAESELGAARRLLARTEDSYRLAAARLVAETGLLAVQIEPLGGPPRIVDLGETTVDLAQSPFILQRRARPLRDCLETAIAAYDRPAARAMLRDLWKLVNKLWDMGLVEETANFHTNYGYVDKILILLDIGELVDDPERVAADRAAPKLLRRKGMAWLTRRDPQLAHELIEMFDS